MEQEGSAPSVCLICLTRRGGMVNYHIRLANALADLMPILAVAARSAPVEYLSKEIPCTTINTGKNGAFSTLLHLPAGLWQFFQAVRTHKASIFHITSDQEWNLFIGMLLRLMGKRLVYTLHNPQPHLGAPWYNILLEKLFRRIPHAYIVLSQHSFRSLCSQGIAPEKIGQTRVGDLFLEPVKPSQAGEKVILMQGRLEPYKGLDDLLQAAHLALPNFLDWRLVIAGTGSIFPDADLLRHPQIEMMHHFIPAEELLRLFERASIVAAPYTEATQSGVIPMAMAMGRPVIATRVGSLPEYVDDEQTGLLVPARDPQSLAAAMLRLMSDAALREKFGQNAYLKYQRELDWRLVARQHLDFYRKTMKDG